jgi:O-succinylbenzoate synthase
MGYQFQFRPYRRKFARSLTTNHGTWDTREGIILRLTDDTGKIGWGEIAPIPWFGSETLQQALEFCRQLPGEIAAETIFSIPDTLPACQFGFESALAAIFDRGGQVAHPTIGRSGGQDAHPTIGRSGGQDAHPTRQSIWLVGQASCGVGVSPAPSCGAGVSPAPEKDADFPSKIPNLNSKIAYSGLLPAGEAALQQWEILWNQGYRTFKWKIGVSPIQEELKIFHQLVGALPKSAKLRLDANGGLNWQQANEWLQECDRIPGIEFLEQPLPDNQVSAMLDLSTRYCSAIALDESVATIDQMQACYRLGWRGIFVIKPGIAGSPSRLRQFCQKYNIDAVFSSVFETAIGRQAALQLAALLSHPHRAIGFGVNHFFAEDEATWIWQLWNNS